MFRTIAAKIVGFATGPMAKVVLEPTRKKYPGVKLLERAARDKNAEELARSLAAEFDVRLKPMQMLVLQRNLAGEIHERGNRVLLEPRDKSLFVVHDFSWRWELQNDLRAVAWGRFGAARKPWVQADEDFLSIAFGSLYEDFEKLFVDGDKPIFFKKEEVHVPIHGKLYEVISVPD